MSKHTRRAFMGAAGMGLAMAAARPAKAAASERVRHAVIGCGGIGAVHIEGFRYFDDCEVVALCDVDPERLAKAGAQLENAKSVSREKDFRKILDDPTIDSVSIGTQDHWHTPMTLAALQAGKHVYVEKPCSHTVAEGRILLDAVKRSGKCVQHGTQARSSKGIRQGIKYLHSGALGEVRVAKAINHQLRKPIGREAETDAPEGVNYDLWLGPAPVHAHTKNRWHYNWRWFWDYGNGDIGNDGIHQVDQARWGLGVALPKSVQGTGGQLFYDDDHQTPDTQTIIYDYGDKHLIYEMRLWTDYKMQGHDNGVIFYCDGGTLEIGRQGCHATPIGGERTEVGGQAQFHANVRSFLNAVKADDPTKLGAPISEGAVSAALCHYGNLVTRTGSGGAIDPETWGFVDNAAANALLDKEYRKGYELTRIG